jgi:RNA-directed DNA polymerase
MKTHKRLYPNLCSLGNLTIAWRKARKGKTKKTYLIKFEKNLEKNLLSLHKELISQTYKPKSLVNFILRDPKTRKISKADFRDRIVHHALVNILKPIFENSFIHDSCANQIGKGSSLALQRFKYFTTKFSPNNSRNSQGFCLKADIKHHFQEVDQRILFHILSKKIKDRKVLWLIKQILINTNFESQRERESYLIREYL